MAKARYSGVRADRTKLPVAPSEDDVDRFFEANLKVEKSECLRTENSVRFNYFSVVDQVNETSCHCVQSREIHLFHFPVQIYRGHFSDTTQERSRFQC
jgi:hypothetical protein